MILDPVSRILGEHVMFFPASMPLHCGSLGHLSQPLSTLTSFQASVPSQRRHLFQGDPWGSCDSLNLASVQRSGLLSYKDPLVSLLLCLGCCGIRGICDSLVHSWCLALCLTCYYMVEKYWLDSGFQWERKKIIRQ